MRVLTRGELFDGLYAAASADGRGEALFGDARADARAFFDRTLWGDGLPDMYLEFPLKGEPALDLLAIYRSLDEGSSFATGAGYGYQDLFSWFSHVDAPEASIGLELDLSQGMTDQAGAYLQHRGNLGLARDFLVRVGAAERAESYEAQARRMPRGWDAAYVGLFPARTGSPLRLGGYLSEPSRRRCAQDPSFLGSRFDLIGFGAYDQQMLERCALLMGMVPAVDFQFDLTAEGSLGPTFGLSLSFSRLAMHEVEGCFCDGYAAQVMGTFEDWGLADGRWRHIAGAPLARLLDYEDEQGRQRHTVAHVRLNYAKVKFEDAVPRAAKFYFVLAAKDLESEKLGRLPKNRS